MSTISLQSGGSPLRRARSTSDIPTQEIPRPERSRISPVYRYSESHTHGTADHSPQLTPIGERQGLCVQSPHPDPTATASRPTEWVPTPVPPVVAEAPSEGDSSRTPWLNDHPPTQPQSPQMSWYARTKLYFGYGRGASRERKAMVDFIWNISWGFVQIVIIITILALAAHMESPTSPGQNEWQACERPLGIWNCLWLARVFLACGLSYWGWCRDRKLRGNDDTESGPATSDTGLHGSPHTNAARTIPRNPPIPRPRTTTPNAPHSSLGPTSNQDPTLPHSHLYARLTLLSSLMTLTWFLTAHILEYTSVNTCRHSSPHLWWLTFGILCIMYIMVLEVFLLGFFVFIVAPIVFIFYNIILICLGRHPLQNPTVIKPEVGNLPKATVDRIPLVIYIPPPPDEAGKDNAPITTPKPIYVYPPKPNSSSLPKRRFAFLRISKRKSKKNPTADGKSSGKEGKGLQSEEPHSWEDTWEQGEYPFVRLEGHRAACAICLLDFEEPKRITGKAKELSGTNGVENQDEAREEDQVQEVSVVIAMEEQGNGELKLTDAGEGVQPLRLLECGHVFHKTCLDPWLIDVSGRCPVCQRPVTLPEPGGKNGRNGRRR